MADQAPLMFGFLSSLKDIHFPGGGPPPIIKPYDISLSIVATSSSAAGIYSSFEAVLVGGDGQVASEDVSVGNNGAFTASLT